MSKSKSVKKEAEIKVPNVTAVYKKFLESVSSGEREVYEKDFVAALRAFRIFVGGMTDKEVQDLLISPAEPVEELPVEE